MADKKSYYSMALFLIGNQYGCMSQAEIRAMVARCVGKRLQKPNLFHRVSLPGSYTLATELK